MKTKIEIIDETVEFYSKNPRSLDENGACVYNGPGGCLCAFSRVVKPEMRNELVEGNDAGSLLSRLGCQILLDDYRIVNPNFWRKIQFLHDNPDHWNGTFTGLSESGEVYVAELKQKYA